MLQLFYVDDINIPDLVGDDAHHASRVLRMKLDEKLLISNGKGEWAICSVLTISKHRVELKILEQGFEIENEIKVSVLQALPKNDRVKECLELLTASGVNKIYPWLASRSIGKESEKWRKLAMESSKQSRRFYLPEISEKIEGASAFSIGNDYEQVLVFHESATTQISELVKRYKNTLIVIGPEGGLTEAELVGFQQNGAQIAKLGKPILRSAHAGIAAVSAVNALMKVW